MLYYSCIILDIGNCSLSQDSVRREVFLFCVKQLNSDFFSTSVSTHHGILYNYNYIVYMYNYILIILISGVKRVDWYIVGRGIIICTFN